MGTFEITYKPLIIDQFQFGTLRRPVSGNIRQCLAETVSRLFLRVMAAFYSQVDFLASRKKEANLDQSWQRYTRQVSSKAAHTWCIVGNYGMIEQIKIECETRLKLVPSGQFSGDLMKLSAYLACLPIHCSLSR